MRCHKQTFETLKVLVLCALLISDCFYAVHVFAMCMCSLIVVFLIQYFNFGLLASLQWLLVPYLAIATQLTSALHVCNRVCMCTCVLATYSQSS